MWSLWINVCERVDLCVKEREREICVSVSLMVLIYHILYSTFKILCAL